jgi:hypothetical protein
MRGSGATPVWLYSHKREPPGNEPEREKSFARNEMGFTAAGNQDWHRRCDRKRRLESADDSSYECLD